MKEDLNDTPFFCSWSGGKDSCLALYRAVQAGGKPEKLLTMFREDGEKSRSHGLSKEVITAQAEAMSIPSFIQKATWDNYEETFISAIKGFRQEGIEHGVFGDIDLQPHLDWVERVCDLAEITAHEPLWKEERRSLLTEFIDAGFKSTIIAVKQALLDDSFLGREIDINTVSDMESAGIDASGEEGEYHTVVTNGPLFSQPLQIHHGEVVAHDGYAFLEITI